MPELQVMPDDWTRALAIAAHPDDLEYGAAAAVARWTEAGRWVGYALASRGEAGIADLPPAECGKTREAEQLSAAATVGVSTVEFLGYPDGTIEYGVPLRRSFTAAIRRHRPELIITVNHRDAFPGNHPNTADHRHVGLATIDAVRDAANRWVFPEQLADAVEPWSGVRWVAVAGSPQPTHAVDISATLDRGVASLQEHRAYLKGLGDHPDARTWLIRMAGAVGQQFGGRPATAFELISF